MSQKKIKLSRKNEPKERDFTAEMQERCHPLISKILLVLGNLPKLPLGLDHEAQNAIYFEVNKAVHALLFESGEVDIEEDIAYIGKGMNELIYMTNQLVSDSIKRNYSILNYAVFGADMQAGDRLTIKKLNDLIVRKSKIKDAVATVMEQPIDEIPKEE